MLAIGSAFGSKAFPDQGHLKFKFVGEEEPVCMRTGDCHGGVFNCKARINGTDYNLKDRDCAKIILGPPYHVEIIVDESIEKVVED